MRTVSARREAAAGRDPLPHYVPPHEDPQTRPDLAAKYPLQMLSPPAPSFLNSTFVNVDVLRKAAGEPTLEMHPADAAARGIADGQTVRVFNDRGRFRAKAVVGETVKPGVVVSLGHLVEQVHRRRGELQRDDEHRADRPRRRGDVLRQPGGSGRRLNRLR